MAKQIGIFERYLTVWIFACIFIGIGTGRAFPSLEELLDSMKVGFVSIPIAIGLFLMMYPVMVRVKLEDLPKAVRSPKELGVTFFFNWAVAPFFLAGLASLFLGDYPEYATGLILLGIAPCIAMVLMWNLLAGGNNALCVVLVAINSLVQMVLYSIYVYILIGAHLDIPIVKVAESVLVFLGLPLVLGFVSRRKLLKARGEEWFESSFLPAMRTTAIIGLLFTLIVMFALKGYVMIENPYVIVLVAVPLAIFFFVMFVASYLTAWRLKIGYENSVAVAFTSASNNFEIAIAVAATVFGIGSGVALATVIGPLIEVPIMLALVYLATKSRPRLFPKRDCRGGCSSSPEKG